LTKGQISEFMDAVESGKVTQAIAAAAFGAKEVEHDGLPF
jgi:hypothetical protein